MTEIAINDGGTIDKYIGDAIMISLWNPLSSGIRKDAISCVSMALEMKRKLRKLRKSGRKLGYLNLLM